MPGGRPSYREHEALDAALGAGVAEPLRPHRVHLPVRIRVELGGRVVRQTREVDDRIDVVERLARDVPDVGGHELDPVGQSAERPLAPVEPVEHPDAVSALEQALHEDAADVSGAAGHEHQPARERRLRGQAVPSGVAPGKADRRLPVSHRRGR
jgi:hypothetical protein